MQGSITVIPRHRNEADAPKCECLAQDHRAEVGNQDSNPGCLAPEPHSSCSIFTLYRSKCVQYNKCYDKEMQRMLWDVRRGVLDKEMEG